MYSIFQPRQRVYFNRLFTHRTDHQDLQSINSKACYPYRHRTRCCECWVSHNYEDPCNSFREVRGAAEDYHQVHLSHPFHLDRHLATAEGGDLSLSHDHHSCQAVKVGECLQTSTMRWWSITRTVVNWWSVVKWCWWSWRWRRRWWRSGSSSICHHNSTKNKSCRNQ